MIILSLLEDDRWAGNIPPPEIRRFIDTVLLLTMNNRR